MNDGYPPGYFARIEVKMRHGRRRRRNRACDKCERCTASEMCSFHEALFQ